MVPFQTCHFIVQQLSLLSSHLSTSPDIQQPTHLHLIRSHQVQFLSSPYTLLLYDEYASVELHLRLMKGVLIKDSGINTAARFGMPSPFSQGNLSSISLIYATIRSLLFLVLCHQHLKHQIYKTIIIPVIIIVKRILIP